MSPAKLDATSIKYAMMPHDLFQRRWYVRIRRQFPDVMERWFWLVCLAQNARSAGRVLIGGEPATAEDVAIAWDRRSTEEDTATWQRAIDAFIDAGILKVDDDCLRIDKPTGWYLPPSKQPHNRDHAREYAQEKRTREDPGRPGKTREDPVRPVHSTSTSTEPVPNQYQTSTSTEPGDGSGAGGSLSGVPSQNGKRNWAQVAAETLAQHLPGDLSTQERQALARISETGGRVGAPPERAIEAIRTHAYSVAYETQFPDHGIRFPRRVALERALADVQANPLGPVPHPWDTDKKRSNP